MFNLKHLWAIFFKNTLADSSKAYTYFLKLNSPIIPNILLDLIYFPYQTAALYYEMFRASHFLFDSKTSIQKVLKGHKVVKSCNRMALVIVSPYFLYSKIFQCINMYILDYFFASSRFNSSGRPCPTNISS